jgi:hypothetical protein
MKNAECKEAFATFLEKEFARENLQFLVGDNSLMAETFLLYLRFASCLQELRFKNTQILLPETNGSEPALALFDSPLPPALLL